MIWKQLNLAVDSKKSKDCISYCYSYNKRLRCLVRCFTEPLQQLTLSFKWDLSWLWKCSLSFSIWPRLRCHRLFKEVRTAASTFHYEHSERLWGALLSAFYVTKCVTILKAQPCKCHRWPSNMHLKGTDISPSPNSFFVSNIQGKHELEEIMVSRKS